MHFADDDPVLFHCLYQVGKLYGRFQDAAAYCVVNAGFIEILFLAFLNIGIYVVIDFQKSPMISNISAD